MKSAIPRRPFREGVVLSTVGFGGMVLVGMQQAGADRVVAEAYEAGVNYFDVGPFYGDGEAENRLGVALEPFRNEVFLACKTLQRQAGPAAQELERSLERLKTSHFDLYQFHSVGKLRDVEQIFAPGGALEVVLRARERGKIRFIGFSSHSVPSSLAMMDRFRFDSILFPVNFVCYARGGFGPQVMERARNSGVARLGIKAMAHGPWRKGEAREFPNCWYRPIQDRDLARAALRFALSQDVTAVIPPGDERLFRLALELAPELTPLLPAEVDALLARACALTPLLRA